MLEMDGLHSLAHTRQALHHWATFPVFLSFCFVFCGGTGIWSLGLMLAQQMLYHLSHSLPFFFWVGVSYVTQAGVKLLAQMILLPQPPE
jgi:hypothetical protein